MCCFLLQGPGSAGYGSAKIAFSATVLPALGWDHSGSVGTAAELLAFVSTWLLHPADLYESGTKARGRQGFAPEVRMLILRGP